MADEQKPQSDEQFLDSLISAGKSDEDIAAAFKQRKAAVQPLVRSRTGSLYRPPAESGLKEFAEGAGQGAVDVLNPMNYIRMIGNATTDPAGFALDAIKAPIRIAGGLITEPAKTLGALTGGAAVGEAIPLGAKPFASTVGPMLEKGGKTAQWPLRMAGAHQLGMANPLGLATMALPEGIQALGKRLTSFGAKSELPPWLDTEFTPHSGGAPIVSDAAPARPRIGVTAPVAKYEAATAADVEAAEKAAENARKLAEIEAGKEGRVPKKNISETLSATGDDGQRVSQVTKYVEQKAADTLSPEDKLVADLVKRNRGMSEDKARSIVQRMNGGAPAAPPAPAIRMPGPGVQVNPEANAENIARHTSYSNGGVMPEALPTELKAQAEAELTKGPTDAAGRPLGGYAGPERRKGNTGLPEGVQDRRGAVVDRVQEKMANGESLGSTGAQADFAERMRVEAARKAVAAGTPISTQGMPAIRIAPNPMGMDSKAVAATLRSQPSVRNLTEWMKQVDDGMAGAASKSKNSSGQWKNLSDNDAVTAANAYASGERDLNKIIEAIVQKKKNRQQDHIANYYADKKPPE